MLKTGEGSNRDKTTPVTYSGSIYLIILPNEFVPSVVESWVCSVVSKKRIAKFEKTENTNI